MPWNEPGGNNQDPWGNRDQKKKDQGPPNLDEVFQKLQKMVGSFLGGSKNGSSRKGDSDGKNASKSTRVLMIFILMGVSR